MTARQYRLGFRVECAQQLALPTVPNAWSNGSDIRYREDDEELQPLHALHHGAEIEDGFEVIEIPHLCGFAHQQVMTDEPGDRFCFRSGEAKTWAELQCDAFTAITELSIYTPDHPRLLALITGACAAAGANIAGAQIFTTTDGMALDTILIQREFTEEEDERRRAERIAELVRKALRGELWLKEAVARAYKPQQRIKAFTVEPRVIIDNQSSNRFTVIEINGLDRIGLLYDLTEALYKLNLNIASAHVTTFGEKAVDVFYVTDLTGAKIENTTRHKQIESALSNILKPAPSTPVKA